MSDVEYLRGVNILKLQTAARMAGMRWKSGAPGYDKAGIIEKLQFTPSVLRATVANIQAMERGTFQNPKASPGGLLDDIAAESAQTPIAQAIPQTPAQSPSVDLSAYLPRTEYATGRESDRLQTRAQIQNLQNETQRGFDARDAAIAELKARVIELSKQTPIQFVLNGATLPPVTGQHASFSRMATWLSIGKNVLLVGPASSGKTTAAVEYAKLKGLELYSQPLSLSVFDVLGFVGPQGRVETEFSRAWQNGGVFLWDELSMSAPEAIGALNAALANGFVSLPGVGTIKKHADFVMLAGDNSDAGATLKYSARSLLDGASLDRFIRIDWPIDKVVEDRLGGSAPDWLACVRAIRELIEKRDIQHVGATMRAVISGCELMATEAFKSGQIPRRWILEDTCKKGALVAEWAAVENLPAVRAFLQGA